MEQKKNKPQLKESDDNMDFVRMQTEVALIDSMTQSKTLTVIVLVGVSSFAGFVYFLFS